MLQLVEAESMAMAFLYLYLASLRVSDRVGLGRLRTASRGRFGGLPNYPCCKIAPTRLTFNEKKNFSKIQTRPEEICSNTHDLHARRSILMKIHRLEVAPLSPQIPSVFTLRNLTHRCTRSLSRSSDLFHAKIAESILYVFN